ncbi:hypothetical protein [Methylomonas sp. AM2-LC]|uniref:hypothetical protein n=1 Tax=Methylomonas sp. AM2-LC TaxID=3153301 RepID=UPI00326491D1
MFKKYTQLTLAFSLVYIPYVVAGTVDSEQTEFAHIGWHQVSAPFGSFLLIRGDEGVCAVRFIEYHKGNDKKQPTIFSSGEESHSAQYEWFYQGDGSGDFSKSSVIRGIGHVSRGAVIGIGRLGFQSGDPYLTCGPIKTFWLQPSSISFAKKINCDKAIYELAPTKWQSINDVHLDSAQLNWYHCDEGRKSFRIPISEL